MPAGAVNIISSAAVVAAGQLGGTVAIVCAIVIAVAVAIRITAAGCDAVSSIAAVVVAAEIIWVGAFCGIAALSIL